METVQRSLERRPVLPLVFEPRARRLAKFWNRVLAYYVRHAERVWRQPQLRHAIHYELRRARATVTACLTGFDSHVLEAYDATPPARRVAIDARFPEIVEYVEIFRIGDRVFTALRHPEVMQAMKRTEAEGIRATVAHALRGPAQLVAEAPRRDTAATPMESAR